MGDFPFRLCLCRSGTSPDLPFFGGSLRVTNSKLTVLSGSDDERTWTELFEISLSPSRTVIQRRDVSTVMVSTGSLPDESAPLDVSDIGDSRSHSMWQHEGHTTGTGIMSPSLTEVESRALANPLSGGGYFRSPTTSDAAAIVVELEDAADVLILTKRVQKAMEVSEQLHRSRHLQAMVRSYAMYHPKGAAIEEAVATEQIRHQMKANHAILNNSGAEDDVSSSDESDTNEVVRQPPPRSTNQDQATPSFVHPQRSLYDHYQPQGGQHHNKVLDDIGSPALPARVVSGATADYATNPIQHSLWRFGQKDNDYMRAPGIASGSFHFSPPTQRAAPNLSDRAAASLATPSNLATAHYYNPVTTSREPPLGQTMANAHRVLGELEARRKMDDASAASRWQRAADAAGHASVAPKNVVFSDGRNVKPREAHGRDALLSRRAGDSQPRRRSEPSSPIRRRGTSKSPSRKAENRSPTSQGIIKKDRLSRSFTGEMRAPQPTSGSKVVCPWCKKLTPADHPKVCADRVVQCKKCLSKVQLRDWTQHKATCKGSK